MRPPRAFVIGHPVAHSRSPLIHGHWLRHHGLPGSYERIDVAPENLAAFVGGFAAAGLIGGNVTIPHKESAAGLVDALTPNAARLGAVNTLSLDPDGRVLGENTDGGGFIAGLVQAVGLDALGRMRTALVLGAGGAARAIAAALLDAGVPRILVANRTAARADRLRDLGFGSIQPIAWTAAHDASQEADLVVNTTSLGMAGQPSLDLDLDLLPREAVVADIVYVPLETPLLAAARARGLRVADGLGMLLHQAVPGFERWFGVSPIVTPELRRLIEAD